MPRVFAAKDEIFCLFKGTLDNLASLRHQYGLAKNTNEAVLVIEAYKALRDRAPFPPSHVVSHLNGDFAFVVFDNAASAVFVASDQSGKVPLYWGITADGYLAFADDSDLLRGSCGKSIASFPEGCFFSTRWGELKSYENPKNKVTCVPSPEEDVWGATFLDVMNSEVSTSCSICLDSIKQEAYLDCCFNKFCYQCITRWVEASTNQSGTNRPLRCPLCKTENSSIIHSFAGDYFQRHYIGKDPERSFSLSDSHKFRLRCYGSDPGAIYQRFDVLGYWEQHRYLKHNRWLHLWLKRELQSLVQVEDVDIIFHHILGVVESFLRRIQQERKSMAEKKQREFRMLVCGAARPFIFEKFERFVDELELFLASGLSIDAYDEVYVQGLTSSRATDETVEEQEQTAQNVLSNLYLEDSDG